MKPGAALVVDALSLPLSAPLPSSFVAPLDKHAPTTYGTQYLLSTGPYMVQADKTGKIAGHRLPARQVRHAGAQPELEREAPICVPRT